MGNALREDLITIFLDKQLYVQVVAPSRNNTVNSDASGIQRNQNVKTIVEQGRIAWQWEMGCNLRIHVKLAMQFYKCILNDIIKAHALLQKKDRSVDQFSTHNRETNQECRYPLVSKK